MVEEAREVVVRFSRDEALILSDWIFRLQQDKDARARCVGDKAVWMPLLRLGGTFETTLPEIFADDYLESVRSARARLLAEMGDVDS